MSDFSTPAIGTATDGQAYKFLDTVAYVRVPGEATDGQWSVVEMHLREGHAPPMHIHESADKTVHVTTGELEAHTRDEMAVVSEGSSIVFPRGEAHTLVAREQTTIVTSTSPAGFDEFVTDVGVATDVETVPAQPPDEDAIDRVAELAPEHAIEIVGPPPIDP